jgi:translation initiation factor IF-2
MRIHELAKKYNVTSDELIALLKKSGHEVSNHMSSVDYEMLSELDKHFSWANTATKKAARKTTARSKAAKATETAPAPKTKVKLRKAKTVEAKPGPEAEAEAKPKAKLSKAKTVDAAPAAVTVEKAPAADKKTAAKKTDKQAEVKAPAAEKKLEATGKSARSKGKAEAAPAAAPPAQEKKKFKLDDLEFRGRVIEEAKPDAPPPPPRRETKEAEQVRESVRRRIAEMETTRKTKRRKTRTVQPEPEDLPPVRVQERITASDFAATLGVPVDDLINRMASLDVQIVPTQPLERESLELLAEEMGRTVEIEAVYGEMQLKDAASIDPAKLVHRAPVVTVMGHVDHGKTSILDYIRKARVAAGEAGGITQHIGAYEVEATTGKITFIDTPGHEAFTAMRARGARCTDIVVLVVAADDGVMPQTIEAINHTRAAGVPMIVAVNKSDVPAANPAQVKQQLMQHNVLVEDFGGEVVAVDVSAKTGANIDKLLEMILLQAEIADLKADPSSRAQGVVVEVRKEEGRGILITLLVQQGTLRVGDVFVVGNEWGKVRSLFDHAGRPVKTAGPSVPVAVLGANGMPEAGDGFISVKDEKEAREVSGRRQVAIRTLGLQPAKALTLEDLYAHIQEGEVKELNVVVKADTNGSMEALRESLAAQDVEGVKVNVMHAAVGTVTETDVLLAANTGGVVISFAAKIAPKAKEIAKLKGVEIRSYRIIYEVIDDIDKALKGLLEPIFEERVLGHAEVRKLFRISRTGTIAGCMVTDGNIQRSAQVRVQRAEETLFTGKIASLKRFQEDVRDVAQNFECGIAVQGFDDLQEGDVIEAFVIEEKARVF